MSSRPLSALLLGAGVLLSAALTVPAAAPRAAAPRLITRTYQVADLVVPVEQPVWLAGKKGDPGKTIEGQLIGLIQRIVEPGTWGRKKGPGQIEYHPLTMALVVRHTPAAHEALLNLLDGLRRLQEVEVRTELRLVSVSDECLERLGVSLQDGEPLSGTVTLTDAQVATWLAAVQSDRGANVLQAPRMMTYNGQQMAVAIGGEDSFRLSLLPTVSPDNRVVTLQMGLHFSQPTSKTTLSVEKTLKVADGKTALLGGWKQEREVRREYSTPILGDMPGLGRLFRTVGYGKEPSRLFVLVTSRVVVAEEGK